MPSSQPATDIVLVGRKLEGNDNLGLGYLLAAARRAGLSATMLRLDHWPELAPVCAHLLALQPLLVGLAMPDGSSAPLPLSLGELLRVEGYRGHVTAGGPFATLARDWLLERYGWLDSVVRHAGEVPLVALARALRRGPNAELAPVPGLTTRHGDGAPAPVLDRTQLELVPARDELPEALGHPMAHVAATRGCPGRCAYCGPAALQRQERQEGLRQGCSAAELRQAGVGGVRRRSLASICDEMAELWHQRGARYFYFVDEHLLPREEGEALDWLQAWQRGLEQRGLGRFGIGCMLRGDLLTARVIRAFVQLGLVRSFVGIELASRAEARCFSRGGELGRGLESMALLRELGVATCCNLMLVHPYSTSQSIADGIELLGSLGAESFEATEMHVYHGTKLQQRMAEHGRLQGNPLQYGYTFPDATVARFAEVFRRLRAEAFGDYSLTCRHYDARFALGLAARLHPAQPFADLSARCEAAGAAGNRLRLDAYRQALELARAMAGPGSCQALVARARAASIENACELERISSQLLRRLARPARAFAPLKAAAAQLIGFCLASATLAACHEPSRPGLEPSAAPGAASAHPGGGPGGGPTEVQVPGPSGSAGAAGDGSGAPASSATGPASLGRSCTEQEQAAAERHVGQLVKQTDPCTKTVVTFGWGQPNGPVRERRGEGPAARKSGPGVVPAIRDGLSPQELACLVQQSAELGFEGEYAHDHSRLIQKVRDACGQSPHQAVWQQVVVELDAQGRVARIRAPQQGMTISPKIKACITQALSGLEFPCLAGESVTEWSSHMVIIE
jgi:radical SAM superfamily enzyme YgiQ (UPF0313 family)